MYTLIFCKAIYLLTIFSRSSSDTFHFPPRPPGGASWYVKHYVPAVWQGLSCQNFLTGTDSVYPLRVGFSSDIKNA